MDCGHLKKDSAAIQQTTKPTNSQAPNYKDLSEAKTLLLFETFAY